MPNPLYPPGNQLYPTNPQAPTDPTPTPPAIATNGEYYYHRHSGDKPDLLQTIMQWLGLKHFLSDDDEKDSEGKGYLLSYGGGPTAVIGGGPRIPTSKPLEYEQGDSSKK